MDDTPDDPAAITTTTRPRTRVPKRRRCAPHNAGSGAFADRFTVTGKYRRRGARAAYPVWPLYRLGFL